MCELITMAGSNFLKWNIEKGTTLTASRRTPHPRAEVLWQIPTARTDKMTNARPIPGGGMGHYYSVFPLTLTFTMLASPWWLLALSYFLTADIKFSCCFSSEIRLLCFFISRFSSFSVIHVSVDKNLAEKTLLFISFSKSGWRAFSRYKPRVTIGSPYLLIELFYSEWGISAFCVLVPCFLNNGIIFFFFSFFLIFFNFRVRSLSSLTHVSTTENGLVNENEVNGFRLLKETTLKRLTITDQ